MQGECTKFVQRACQRCTVSFEAMPEAGRQGARAKGAMASLRVDNARSIPPADFVHTDQRFVSVEPHRVPSCSCCGPEDADSHYARIFPRSGPREKNSTNPYPIKRPRCRPPPAVYLSPDQVVKVDNPPRLLRSEAVKTLRFRTICRYRALLPLSRPVLGVETRAYP